MQQIYFPASLEFVWNVLSVTWLSYVGTVIDIVCVHMQEWQNSIQKNAGLAFIELVNEGR